VFCTIGLSNMLRITLERKRFRRMKETLKDELRAELFLKSAPKPEGKSSPVFENPAANVAAYAFKAPPPTLSDTDGYFARRKKRKLAKEIEAIERERRRQEAKAAMLRAKIGGSAMPANIPAPPPPPITPPQRQGMTSGQVTQMASEYNSELMQQFIAEQMARMQQQRPQPQPQPQARVEVYH
jgi:hypothetical protein